MALSIDETRATHTRSVQDAVDWAITQAENVLLIKAPLGWIALPCDGAAHPGDRIQLQSGRHVRPAIVTSVMLRISRLIPNYATMAVEATLLTDVDPLLLEILEDWKERVLLATKPGVQPSNAKAGLQ